MNQECLSSDLPDNVVSGSGTYDDPYISLTNDFINDRIPNSIIKYTEAPGAPTIQTDESGNISQIESNEEISLTDNDYDTGVLAFDDKGFTIHLKFSFNSSSNVGKYILSAIEDNGAKKYKGFAFIVYSQGYPIRPYSSSEYVTMYSSGTFGSYINNGFAQDYYTYKGEQTYTLDIDYTPATTGMSTLYIKCQGNIKKPYEYTSMTKNIPASLENCTIHLSGRGIENDTVNMKSMKVIEFKVTKK